MTQDLRRLGERLTVERLQAGLSQEAVGAQVRLHGTTVLRIERGKQASVEALVVLGRLFGLELCWRKSRRHNSQAASADPRDGEEAE